MSKFNIAGALIGPNMTLRGMLIVIVSAVVLMIAPRLGQEQAQQIAESVAAGIFALGIMLQAMGAQRKDQRTFSVQAELDAANNSVQTLFGKNSSGPPPWLRSLIVDVVRSVLAHEMEKRGYPATPPNGRVFMTSGEPRDFAKMPSDDQKGSVPTFGEM
jgi:hypothetical protein